MKLRDLYIGQLSHLKHSLKERRRQFLLEWQAEGGTRGEGLSVCLCVCLSVCVPNRVAGRGRDEGGRSVCLCVCLSVCVPIRVAGRGRDEWGRSVCVCVCLFVCVCSC